MEMDGLHVYDRDFSGEGEYSPGLEIDMLNTPCMIAVANSEKERFLTFLIKESAWKDMLAQMSQDEFDEWIDKNVIFADSIREIFSEAKAKEIFDEKKKLQRQKGYVIPTGILSQMKAGSHRTLRFVPEK